jgi:membrane-associated phospholipid phosphatase
VTARSRWPEPGRGSRRRAALLGVACLVGFVVCLLVGVRTGIGQRVDAAGLTAFVETVPAPIRRFLSTMARSGTASVLAVVVVALGLVAAARGRRVAVLTAVLLPVLCLPLSLYLRDQAVSRPDLGVRGYDYNTFPSVHATAALTLLMGVALLWPRRWTRGLAAAVVGVAGLVCAGNVAWYAHRPVDVLGSVLLVVGVTATWAAIAGPARVRASGDDSGLPVSRRPTPTPAHDRGPNVPT